MAKKRATKKSTESKKSRMELRFDTEFYEKLKKLADDSGLTVNQLMQGIAKWLLPNAHSGEPKRDHNGKIYNKEQIGCVWFGQLGENMNPFYLEEFANQENMKPEEYDRKYCGGEIWGEIDFTERRVVREDF